MAQRIKPPMNHSQQKKKQKHLTEGAMNEIELKGLTIISERRMLIGTGTGEESSLTTNSSYSLSFQYKELTLSSGILPLSLPTLSLVMAKWGSLLVDIDCPQGRS